MKTSIAITLIIIATIFSFVSGYSIGSHSDQAVSYRMADQATSGSVATAGATEKADPAAGYGASSDDASSQDLAASPGYGAPSPGYGQ
jgi:FlaG/FlaF family flagellin (archaellin)